MKKIIFSCLLKKKIKIIKIDKKRIEKVFEMNDKLKSLISLSIVNFLRTSLLKKIPQKRENNNRIL
tara:strand:- start:288 stop:485 length:198 start_codon:yes stop_codon:yes gene_type:complete